MPKAPREITHDVLGLPRNQQLALAQFLLRLDDADAAWDGEIRARLAAYDTGRVETVPFDQIRQTMAQRFAGGEICTAFESGGFIEH